VEQGFTTLLGGSGRDTLEGSDAVTGIEKFYGGRGDDLIHWSRGFNIIHGGQPQLAYGDDGTDVIDYSGAGTVTITMNRHWAPHKVPNFVAVFDGGLDYLFSVERIQWNAKTDRIVLGKGVNLIEDDRVQPSVFGGDDRHRPVGLRSASLATADLSMSMPYCRIAAWRRTPRIRPSSPRSRQTSLRATTASFRLSCCPSPTRPHRNRWPHLAMSCIGRSDFADNSLMMHAVPGGCIPCVAQSRSPHSRWCAQLCRPPRNPLRRSHARCTPARNAPSCASSMPRPCCSTTATRCA
jgi:hypothetical protein